MSRVKMNSMPKIGAGVVVAVIAGIFVLSGIRVVEPSEVGVVVRLGEIRDVKPSGVSWQMPFLTSVKTMDVSQKRYDGVYETSTKDMQTTKQFIVTQYLVDTSKVRELYESFLGNHEENIIKPILASVVQDSVSELSIEELVSNRIELATTMTEKAKAELAPYGIRIVSMQITDHDFSDEYDNAVEAKKVAEQKVLTSKQEQEAAKIDAETNRILSQTYDDNVKFKMFLEKWDGKLPVYMAGESDMMNMLLPMDTMSSDIAESKE